MVKKYNCCSINKIDKMGFVRNIINEGDPICLFPMAPEDEYEDEIAQIYYLLRKGKMSIESIEDIKQKEGLEK